MRVAITALVVVALALSPVWAVTETGVDFPTNQTVNPDTDENSPRFRWVRPDLNGLPIYGPDATGDATHGVTYIWRYYPRQHTGYYTTFFYAGDGSFPSTFTYYYGAHPYPCNSTGDQDTGCTTSGGNGGTTHMWEISVQQSDIVDGGALTKGRWYTQAMRVWEDSSGQKHHWFYFDLDAGVGDAQSVDYVAGSSYAETPPANLALTWGDAPWAPGNETGSGIHRGIQIYNKALSVADMQAEAAVPLSTADGQANIWYLNMNPTPDDISDKSGQGHHPEWVNPSGTFKPTLYSSTTNGGPCSVVPVEGAVNGGNMLQRAAAGLGGQEWCEMSPASQNNATMRQMMYAVGTGCGNSISIANYASSMGYSSVSSGLGKIWYFGTPHGGGYRQIFYDIPTNTWSAVAAPSGECGTDPGTCSVGPPENTTIARCQTCSAQHSYDSVVGANDYFYRLGHGRQYITRTTGAGSMNETWEQLDGGVNNAQGVMAFWPTLGAQGSLIYIHYSAGDVLKRYDIATDTHSGITGSLWSGCGTDGDYHTTIEYHPTADEIMIWQRLAPGCTKRLYNNGGVPTLQAKANTTLSPPLNVAYDECAADPASDDKYVCFKAGITPVWHEYDSGDDTWTTFSSLGITNLPPIACTDNPCGDPAGDSFGVLNTVSDEYGVIVYLAGSTSNSPNNGGMYVYRHTSATPVAPTSPLTTITVKEPSGVAVSAQPTVAIFPLSEGYSTLSTFRLWDVTAAAAEPAQFSVVSERYDGTARFGQVAFNADVGSGSSADYQIATSGATNAPTAPVVVLDDTPSGYIQVTTGPLRFTVNKTAFNVIDTAWYDLDSGGTYETGERIIVPSSSNGGRVLACDEVGVNNNCSVTETQHDAAMGAPDLVTIEESGPMRAVIRVERYTRYNGVNNHKHGYVVRLYAYAGKPWIDIDYQLVNAATDDWGNVLDSGKFANPFYYDYLHLDFALNLATTTVKASTAAGVDSRTLPGAGYELAYTDGDTFAIRSMDEVTTHASCDDPNTTDTTNSCATPGFIDAADGTWGVQAISRNMWQTQPSGLAVTGGEVLQLQLFPDWGAMPAYAGTGLYWLMDQGAVYKQYRLIFHGATPLDADLRNAATSYQRGPVATLPYAYRQSVAEGTMPYGAMPDDINTGTPSYYHAYMAPGGLDIYQSGDLNHGSDSSRKTGASRWYAPDNSRILDTNPGGGAPTAAWFPMVSESTRHVFNVERWAQQELNCRPWMGTDYTYADDYNALTLGPGNGEDPFSYRGSSDPAVTTGYRIAGTARVCQGRDEQHRWDYHALDSYWTTGNLWVKDWAKWNGEINRGLTISHNGEFDRQARSIAHAIADTHAAYLTTGDATLIEEAADYLWYYWLLARDDCGYWNNPDGGNNGGSLSMGFFLRALGQIADELHGNDWARWSKLMTIAGALTDYNLNWGHWEYGGGGGDLGCRGAQSSSGTAHPLLDPVSWWYWRTGKTAYWTDAQAFFSTGVNGGSRTYCGADGSGPLPDLFPCDSGTTSDADPENAWAGQFEGPMYWYVNETTRADAAAPDPPLSPSVVNNGSNADVSWTAPFGEAPSYYLATVCDKTITASWQSSQASSCSWWWGTPGASASTTANIPHSYGAGVIYAAVFAFDAADNMSAMSSVVSNATGECAGQANGTPCTDTDETNCYQALCQSQSCSQFAAFEAASYPCNDGIACTQNDVCNGSDADCDGVPNNALCNDSDVCTDDTCGVETGCGYTFNTAPCDDGLFCIINEACAAGSCVGVENTCSDADVCTSDSCNETLDVCEYVNICGGQMECIGVSLLGVTVN